ncbi:hypothetical protein DWZ56_22015 [Lachnotalea sp. AF33-28]|nr:hypothetical protein DWZ56_22015 [Lachnotalea sp. AF33-28]
MDDSSDLHHSPVPAREGTCSTHYMRKSEELFSFNGKKVLCRQDGPPQEENPASGIRFHFNGASLKNDR